MPRAAVLVAAALALKGAAGDTGAYTLNEAALNPLCPPHPPTLPLREDDLGRMAVGAHTALLVAPWAKGRAMLSHTAAAGGHRGGCGARARARVPRTPLPKPSVGAGPRSSTEARP